MLAIGQRGATRSWVFQLLTCVVTGRTEGWVVDCQGVGTFWVPKDKGSEEA